MKIKDQILEYKTEYIKGTFSIKEIAFLFKFFKEITKVTEIIAPNYLQPFKVGDMVVGDYK